MVDQATGDRPLTGTVLNIQHFCTHDGPGMRTTVFLKGCSLRCRWCSNPESIHHKPELAYNPQKCLGEKECGLCLKSVCAESAVYVVGSGERADDKIRINWSLCTDCGACVGTCPAEALYLFGKEMTVEQVLQEVEQDSAFYRESGGGLTVSGGECQLQADFVAALLAGAHERGINTAIETASNVPWEFMAKVLPHVDVMLHDHKLSDPERHKKWCGADNTRIRANLKKAYETFPNTTFIARTPVIPGVNDDEDHIRSVLEFIRPHRNVIDYELLPYHRFGESKYGFLGRVYGMRDFTSPTPERMQQLQALIDQAFGRTPQPASPTVSPQPMQSPAAATEAKRAEPSGLNAVVTLRNEVSPWLMLLQVTPDGWDLPEFTPGQTAYLGLPAFTPRCGRAEAETAPPEPDKLVRRAYSIASSSLNREFMEFYVALVPGGVLTPRLFNLKIGDRIWLSAKVNGMFNFHQVPDDANVVMIANGSGLSAYISMLSTHLKPSSQRRVMLMHGVRHSWDLGYRSILMAMQNLRANFSYLPVISRPQEEPVKWKGATGRVQDQWKEGTVEKAWGFKPTPKNTHVFLCGSSGMVQEMTDLLTADGFAEHTKAGPGQIHASRYWHT